MILCTIGWGLLGTKSICPPILLSILPTHPSVMIMHDNTFWSQRLRGKRLWGECVNRRSVDWNGVRITNTAKCPTFVLQLYFLSERKVSHVSCIYDILLIEGTVYHWNFVHWDFPRLAFSLCGPIWMSYLYNILGCKLFNLKL